MKLLRTDPLYVGVDLASGFQRRRRSDSLVSGIACLSGSLRCVIRSDGAGRDGTGRDGKGREASP